MSIVPPVPTAIGARILTDKELGSAAVTATERVVGITINKEVIEVISAAVREAWFTGWQEDGDLTFYGGDSYAIATLGCWLDWSRVNVRSAVKWFQRCAPQSWLEDKVAVDCGAGIGATTVQIAQAFPEWEVHYMNVPGVQWDIAKELFTMVDTQNVVMVDERHVHSDERDIVFAMELMEHFKSPLEELRRYVTDRTAVYVDGSSFHVEEAGHWDVFNFDGVETPRKLARRAFNKELRNMGFAKAYKVVPGDKNFWNDMPLVHVRPEMVADFAVRK